MTLPQFAENPTVKKTVPAFDGGLNVADAPWLIADNELSQACNVWFRDGMLRTRPGFVTSTAWQGTEPTDATVRYLQDRNGWLVCVSSALSGGSDVLTVSAREPKGGAVTQLLYEKMPPFTTFACVPSGGSVGEYTLLLYTSEGRAWALDPSQGKADEMTDRFYVPTVSVNGKPAAARNLHGNNGEAYQQRNRLTDRVKCCFTPDGVGMYYYLPYRNINGEVRIQVTGMGGFVYEYVVPAEETESQTVAKKYVILERYTGMFYFKDRENENTALIDLGMRNSVVAECHVPVDIPLVFDMTFGTWYGGDKNETGGERLVLCGNARYPAALIWSVAEDPFYFPENARTTVGVSGEAITALGKQDGHLVLFKEHEVYTAENIRGGADADSTSQATFPIYAIHNEVGCDLPDTVALFGNRLTWAAADGQVYQLASPTLSGNRNVLTVSDGIHAFLRGKRKGISASACVWEGHYCLLYGEDIWLLRKGDPPAWYRWQWHDPLLRPCELHVHGAQLFVFAKHENMGNIRTFWFTVEGERDVFPFKNYGEKAIYGMAKTKAFDGEIPHVYKRIECVAVQSETALAPLYITERGEHRDTAHRPDRSGLIVSTPNLTRCRQLAVQWEGEGLTLGGMTVQLRAERRIRW